MVKNTNWWKPGDKEVEDLFTQAQIQEVMPW